ncbi:hypothetical protein DFJ77DRAFT_92267 [Powellomyces hirtus]|nr:hypothetical protein DFJ77DRAFT_92267 [Powellomyces hirtus]
MQGGATFQKRTETAKRGRDTKPGKTGGMASFPLRNKTSQETAQWDCSKTYVQNAALALPAAFDSVATTTVRTATMAYKTSAATAAMVHAAMTVMSHGATAAMAPAQQPDIRSPHFAAIRSPSPALDSWPLRHAAATCLPTDGKGCDVETDEDFVLPFADMFLDVDVDEIGGDDERIECNDADECSANDERSEISGEDDRDERSSDNDCDESGADDDERSGDSSEGNERSGDDSDRNKSSSDDGDNERIERSSDNEPYGSGADDESNSDNERDESSAPRKAKKYLPHRTPTRAARASS